VTQNEFDLYPRGSIIPVTPPYYYIILHMPSCE